MLTAPYIATMRWFDGTVGLIAWAPARPGARVIEEPILYRSSRFFPDLPWDDGAPGEIPTESLVRSSARVPARVIDGCFIGPIEWWGEAGWPSDAHFPELAPDGWVEGCSCCMCVDWVGLAADVNTFLVSGSPITSFGNLSLDWVDVPAGYVLSGPASGPPAKPTFKPASAGGVTVSGVLPIDVSAGPSYVVSAHYPFKLQPPSSSTTPLQLEAHGSLFLADFLQILDNTATQFGARIDSNGSFSNPNPAGGAGPSNEIFGALAGLSLIDSTQDTFFGYKAGFNEDHGQKNSAFGSNALQNLHATNFDDTAIGALALNGLFGGSGNTAIGSSSMEIAGSGDQNTCVGWAAAGQQSGGDHNSGFGAKALYQNSGNCVTGLGFQAGLSNNGDDNTYVGCSSDMTGGPYSNSTAIGAGSQITGSHQIVMGTVAETTVFPGPTSGIAYGDLSGAPGPSPSGYATGSTPITLGLSTLFSVTNPHGLIGSFGFKTPLSAGSGTISWTVTDTLGNTHTSTSSFTGQVIYNLDFGFALFNTIGFGAVPFLPIATLTIEVQASGTGSTTWVYGYVGPA